MEITLKKTADDLFSFVSVHGWKAIVPDVVERYLAKGTGSILEPIVDQRSLDRDVLRLSRIFNGYDSGPEYRRKGEELAGDVFVALALARRRLNGAGEQVASSLKECGDVHQAVLTNASEEVVERELLEAFDSMAELLPGCRVTVHIERI